MNLRDIERLEYRLQQATRQRDTLQQQNQAQQRTIEQLRHEVDHLKQKINQDPMHMREVIQSPLSSEGKVAQLEEFVKSLTFQLAYVGQTSSHNNFQLAELQTRLCEMELVLSGKDHDIDNLHLQIQDYKARDQMQSEMIHNINEKLAASNQAKLKLIDQIANLQQALQQEKNNNQARLAGIADEVVSLKEFLARRPSPSESSKARDFSEESRLLAIQQAELQARNEQILRLRTIVDGHSGPSEGEYLKNTIKHLRGQIGRYNAMMKKIIQRSALAESLIKKYEDSMKKCETELQMIANLKEQNNNLKIRLESLQLDLREAEAELLKEKKVSRETKKILVEALTENQSYHELIHESYPDTYDSYINRHRQEYEERLAERQKNQKWTSVQELIEVNQKLRKKLKLI